MALKKLGNIRNGTYTPQGSAVSNTPSGLKKLGNLKQGTYTVQPKPSPQVQQPQPTPWQNLSLLGKTQRTLGEFFDHSHTPADNSVAGLINNTIAGIPGSVKDIATNTVQHPINTAQAIGSGVYSGLNGLRKIGQMTGFVPKFTPEIQAKADEMFNYQPKTPAEAGLKQGFDLSASNVPYMLSGELMGKMLPQLPRLAAYLGWTGTSQLLSDKKITDVKGRAQQAALDSLMFVLTGGLRKPKGEVKTPQSSPTPETGQILPPESIPEVKTPRPQLNESLSYKPSTPQVPENVKSQPLQEGVNPLIQEAKKFKSPEDFINWAKSIKTSDYNSSIEDQAILAKQIQSEGKTPTEAFTNIWNKAHQIETNPLIQEARKYKSAEDFVKAQQNPLAEKGVLYHGSPEKFNAFDLSKSRETNHEYGNGISFTENPNKAGSYALDDDQAAKWNRAIGSKELRNQGYIYKVKPNRSILDFDATFTDKELNKISNEVKKHLYNEEIPDWEEKIADIKNGGTGADLFEALQKHFGDSTGSVMDDLGYSGIKSSPNEIRIFNPKDIKIEGTNTVYSKSQLTDIWNKSQPLQEGDVSTFYNVDNLKISDQAKASIKNEISNSKAQLEATVGKTLTNKEVLDTANLTGKILDKTVTREQTEAKIAANLRLRQQIAKSAQDGKIDSSFIDLWIKDKAAGEDIARQLQARAIIADPQEAGAINSILDSIYKVNKNADEIVTASKGVDFNDAKQVTEFYRKFVKPKVKDWIDLLRYNSMLSSPNTHMVNATSNIQGSGILAPIEKTVTGIIDATRSALTGNPRKYYAGEGVKYAKGYFSNIAEASKRFVGVLRGDVMNANPDVRNIPLSTGGFKRGVENVLSFPLKMLEASDQFFSALSEGGSKASLSYRAGKGVDVGDIGNLAKEEAAYRLFRESGNTTQGHVLSALDSVTNVMMQLRNSPNPVTSTIAKFTLPFVRTPMNIFKQGVEYSPAGLTTLWGASNKTEQLSKVIIGMASATGAATLLGEGRLTWAEPTSQKQKNDFRAAGMQAYSIKIGDHWVSYAKLHPAIAFNMALIAALDDSLNKNKLTDDTAGTILDTFAKYGNFLADQSYAKNIGDFLAATKGSAEQYTAFFSNYPQQLIPLRSLMGWVTRIIDPYQRKIDTDGSMLDKQMQQIMSAIPGLSTSVPTRNDQFGNPIENQNPLLNALSPYRVTNVNPQMQDFWNMQQEQRRMDAASTDTHTKQKAMIMQGLADSNEQAIRDAFALDPVYAQQNFKTIVKDFQMQNLTPEQKIQAERIKFNKKKLNPFYGK